MFLRNKIAILSITLMSLLTIPTLAENDNQSVTSRIENENFDIQIKTPEGWSETKDFTSIPETFTFDGQVYRGLQFRNGSEFQGCAIFFAEDSLIDDEYDGDSLINSLLQIQELAFPESVLSNFSLSKVTVDGGFSADFNTKAAKISLKGVVEGSLSHEAGDPTQITIAGSLSADSAIANFALGTGTLIAEGAMPISGTTGIVLGDDYQIFITTWGADEKSQVSDTYRFLEAITVKAKAPAETDAVAGSETVEETSDAVVVAEIVVEVTSDAVVTESIAVTEVVEETPETTEASV